MLSLITYYVLVIGIVNGDKVTGTRQIQPFRTLAECKTYIPTYTHPEINQYAQCCVQVGSDKCYYKI